MPAFLPYARHTVTPEDEAAVLEILRSDNLTQGPQVEAFEREFAEKVGAKYAVAVSSGTAALHVALTMYGVGPGDEVIVPALTFAATANAVLMCGARPLFADVYEDTLFIDLDSVDVKTWKRACGVINVDYAGLPSGGTGFIRDAAHSLGATIRGRPLGQLSALTCYSLHPAKHVAAGEGGMVTTDIADFADRLRAFRDHGRVDGWMEVLGYNYRLSDIACALGRSQLRRLDANLARRREIAAAYNEAFRDLPYVQLPAELPDRTHAWHLYPIRFYNRDEVRQRLRTLGIGTQVHYPPVYWHPYYRKLGYERGLCPVAEAAYERLLSLPIWPGMTDGDVERVIDGVRGCFPA